jgi:hypothetical protein
VLDRQVDQPDEDRVVLLILPCFVRACAVLLQRLVIVAVVTCAHTWNSTPVCKQQAVTGVSDYI